MRIRGKYVVVLALALVVGVVVYRAVLLRSGVPARSEDFLEEARRLAEEGVGDEGRGSQQAVRDADEMGDVPVMVVEPIGSIDLGTIPREGLVDREIKIYNRGKALLEITSVTSKCGCTHATIDPAAKKIVPGGMSVVKVSVDPARINGFESDKPVIIMSNDPVNTGVEINVHAKVDPEFQMDPPVLDFGEIRKGTPCEKTAIFRQLTDEPLEVTEVVQPSKHPGLSFSFSRRPETEWLVPGKAEYVIAASVSDETPPGSLKGAVNIVSTCKRLPKYYHKIEGVVTSFYTVSPQSTLLVSGSLAKAGKGMVSVNVAADRPFEIVDLQPSVGDVAAFVKPGMDPNTATIELSLKPDSTPEPQHGNLAFVVKSGEETLKNRINVRIVSDKAMLKPDDDGSDPESDEEGTVSPSGSGVSAPQ